jgi:hypothetical protein
LRWFRMTPETAEETWLGRWGIDSRGL